MPAPIEVVIEIEGGCVASVRSTSPEGVKVIIVDRDDEAYGDECTEIPTEYLHCEEHCGDYSWVRMKEARDA